MQVPRDFVDKIKNGECILFLGAGVHAPPPEGSCYSYPLEQRPPLAGDLAEKLANECSFKEELPEDSPRDLQRVSLFIETKPGWGRKNLIDNLEKYLRHESEKKPSPALKMLAALPFKIFVTTNFDLLLDDALNECKKKPQRIVYNPISDVPTKDVDRDPTAERPLLFKMHGDLDERKSIVITDEDYIRFVQRMADKDTTHPVPRIIRSRMTQWFTLFVGYSLKDYNLRLLFRTLRWGLDEAEFPASFAVDTRPDELIKRVWQDKRGFIAFIVENLWRFVPTLYKEVHGEEYPA